MPDEVKKVGIEWQVKYDDLKKVQKEQLRYINNMKKMHQVQKSDMCGNNLPFAVFEQNVFLRSQAT